MQKNPFKKKRGEGYVPTTADNMPTNDMPQESLATHSLLNQKQVKEEDN